MNEVLFTQDVTLLDFVIRAIIACGAIITGIVALIDVIKDKKSMTSGGDKNDSSR